MLVVWGLRWIEQHVIVYSLKAIWKVIVKYGITRFDGFFWSYCFFMYIFLSYPKSLSTVFHMTYPSSDIIEGLWAAVILVEIKADSDFHTSLKIDWRNTENTTKETRVHNHAFIKTIRLTTIKPGANPRELSLTLILLVAQSLIVKRSIAFKLMHQIYLCTLIHLIFKKSLSKEMFSSKLIRYCYLYAHAR